GDFPGFFVFAVARSHLHRPSAWSAASTDCRLRRGARSEGQRSRGSGSDRVTRSSRSAELAWPSCCRETGRASSALRESTETDVLVPIDQRAQQKRPPEFSPWAASYCGRQAGYWAGAAAAAGFT